MRLRLPLLLAAVVLTGAGCATVMSKVGTLVAGAMTGSTDDLSEINVALAYADRSAPAATGEAGIAVLGDDWRDDTPVVSATLMKRQGVGFLNLDGEVRLDGAEMPRVFPGSYSTFLGTPAASPLAVSFASAQGQSETYRITPRPAIRVTAINGQDPQNATISLNESLVLEIDRGASDAAELRIALLGTTMGVKGFWDVAVVRAADRIELPAEIWAHTQGNPINRGDNWLKVEEYVRPETQAGDSGGRVLVVAYASDYAPVTVTGERPDNAFGLAGREAGAFEGTTEAGGREVEWRAVKPVAFQSPPLGYARRLALVTMKVEARGLSQSETSTSVEDNRVTGTRTTTTTTRSRQFAQLGDAFWDALLGDVHGGLMRHLGRVMDAEIFPVADVVASAAYQRFSAVEDENTAAYVSRSYGGLRDLDATSFTSLFTDATGPFSAAKIDDLLGELGVDGLIVAELDLSMPFEEFSLTPSLTFRVLAPQSDPMQYAMAPAYLEVTATGEGREVTNDMLDDTAQLRAFLPTAINLDALMAAFGEAVDAVAAFERGQPVYRSVWNGRYW